MHLGTCSNWPVLLEGLETTSTPRKVLVDESSIQVGAPIWIEIDAPIWRQGTVTRGVHSEVHMRLLT